MVPLMRAIPAKPAMEMLLTGAPMTARRALELGLVNQVVPNMDLDLAIRSFTETILAMSPLVLQIGKEAFYEIQGLDEADAYDRAVPIMTENAVCHDAQEGISAFLKKRLPRWSGT
jgi:enoyl-CoA hydratase/carnithine racemase